MDDLTAYFPSKGISQDELIAFLSSGWSSTTTDKGNYLYGHCIEVQCDKSHKSHKSDKNHKIIKILGDREAPLVAKKIREFAEAFSDAGLTVGMLTAYSRQPLRGIYRYHDILQIYPTPPAGGTFFRRQATRKPVGAEIRQESFGRVGEGS